MDDANGVPRSALGSAVQAVLLLAVIFGTGVFLYENGDRLRMILFPPAPCSAPIRYAIGSVDPRFNVATTTLQSTLETASAVWGDAAGKALFAYEPSGPLKINLVYDHRQAANDELKKLGYSITNDRESFDSMKQNYESENASYEAKKSAYDALLRSYDAKLAAYNADVRAANERGGATREEAAKFKQVRAELESDLSRLRAAQAELNALVSRLNAMGDVLNRQARSLNVKIDQTNAVSESLGEEYEEGKYTSDEQGEAITIYSINSQEDLQSILTHELGHALGLDHVDDPTAVMYYLNRNQLDLSETDVSAIRSLCSE